MREFCYAGDIKFFNHYKHTMSNRKRNSGEYITTTEIVNKLGLSYSSVLRLIHGKTLPAVAVGVSLKRPVYRILRSDFEKFLQERKTIKDT